MFNIPSIQNQLISIIPEFLGFVNPTTKYLSGSRKSTEFACNFGFSKSEYLRDFMLIMTRGSW